MGLWRKGRGGGGGGGGGERESCAGRGRNWNGLESHTEWAAVACSPQSVPELIAEGIEGLNEQESDSRRGKTLLDPPLTMAEDYIVSAAESLPPDNLIPPPRLRHQYGVFSCRVLSDTLFFPKTIFSVRIVHGASTHSSVWTRNMQQMHSKYTKCRCVASVGVPTCENVTFTGAACVTSHRTCN